MTMNRREHLKSLIGLAALPLLPQTARTAQNAPVPPEGIGYKIRHLAYSDIGGRPDSVQIMLNRRHLYVGHMFSNGLTILDAADPRRLKPVGFFTGGDFTRTHHLQVAEDMPFRPEHSRHFPSPGDEGDCLSRNAGPGHQSPLVAGRTIRLRCRAFR